MLKETGAPKFKKEWPGKRLLLKAPHPDGGVTPSEGQEPLVRIERRLNAKDTNNGPHDISRWGAIRVLKVNYRCKYCGAHHSGYLPESWIDEGKAVFVEVEK